LIAELESTNIIRSAVDIVFKNNRLKLIFLTNLY